MEERREIEVFIDTDEIAEYFLEKLIERGYVPTNDEIDEIADIVFDYLVDKCIVDDVE